MAVLVQVFCARDSFKVLQPTTSCDSKPEIPQSSQRVFFYMRVSCCSLRWSQPISQVREVLSVAAIGLIKSKLFCILDGFRSVYFVHCCSLLAFHLPAFFHVCLFRDEPSTRKNGLQQLLCVCAIMTVGFVMLGAGAIEAIHNVL